MVRGKVLVFLAHRQSNSLSVSRERFAKAFLGAQKKNRNREPDCGSKGGITDAVLGKPSVHDQPKLAALAMYVFRRGGRTATASSPAGESGECSPNRLD